MRCLRYGRGFRCRRVLTCIEAGLVMSLAGCHFETNREQKHTVNLEKTVLNREEVPHDESLMTYGYDLILDCKHSDHPVSWSQDGIQVEYFSSEGKRLGLSTHVFPHRSDCSNGLLTFMLDDWQRIAFLQTGVDRISTLVISALGTKPLIVDQLQLREYRYLSNKSGKINDTHIENSRGKWGEDDGQAFCFAMLPEGEPLINQGFFGLKSFQRLKFLVETNLVEILAP